MDHDPGQVRPRHLTLAGVEAGPDFEAEAADRVTDGPVRLDGPPRRIEGGEEPVTSGLDL